ncbi:hypothetical protein L0222_00855 [bacterium]|nr:hypothetical protein [bacterium]
MSAFRQPLERELKRGTYRCNISCTFCALCLRHAKEWINQKGGHYSLPSIEWRIIIEAGFRPAQRTRAQDWPVSGGYTESFANFLTAMKEIDCVRQPELWKKAFLTNVCHVQLQSAPVCSDCAQSIRRFLQEAPLKPESVPATQASAKEVEPSEKQFHCFFCSGNQSVIASFYKVIRNGLSDAPAGHYKIPSGALLSKNENELPAVSYFGESVLGAQSTTTLPSMKDALQAIALSGMEQIHIAYVSINQERFANLGIAYNKILEEAVKQGILPFRMIVTAVKEAAQYILDCCDPVEITDSLKKVTAVDSAGIFVPPAGYRGFCQMCGKGGIHFKIFADRAFFLCSPDCENRYGTLRADAIKLSQVSTVIDETGSGMAEQIRVKRQNAYDSNSYCWFCGKAKKMGLDNCSSCNRQADVPVNSVK